VIAVIDLHAHIVPMVDDGASSLEESVKMLRVAKQDGISTVVATPHIYELDSEDQAKAKISAIEDLKRHLKQDTVKIVSGAEVMLREDLIEFVEKCPEILLGQGGKYILVEMPIYNLPFFAEEILFKLQLRQITPIIAHVERYFWVWKNPERLYRLVESGCLAQVNASSLTDRKRAKSKAIAIKMLKDGIVQLIASDAHSPSTRPPILSRAIAEASKYIDEHLALQMVTTFPQVILDGERIKWEVGRKNSGKRSRFFGKFLRAVLLGKG